LNDYPPASDAPQPVQPQQPVRVALPRAVPYVTYTIIGVTIFFYLLQLASLIFFNFDLPIALFAKINEEIQAGQLWRLLTPALLHDDQFPSLHIFFNMYALFSLGTGLERYFGGKRFLLLYVLGAFTGNVASFLFSNAPSIGASTAIFGLIGAQGIFFYQNRKLFGDEARRAIGNVVFVAAINLLVIGSLPFIDNWGHIGGLVGGLMFTSLAGPLWDVEAGLFGYSLVDKRPARDVMVGAAAVVIIFGALAFWGMVR
jgi:rhomboid protease GluP